MSLLAAKVLDYDRAIESCANDPKKMTEFGTATGDTLDVLYAEMVVQAQKDLGLPTGVHAEFLKMMKPGGSA